MPTDQSFAPTTELAGPPDPWESTGQPSHRATPPYHMTEMIEAEPALARRLLGHDPVSSGAAELASAVRDAAAGGLPIVVVGCGTSEHGAQGVVEIIRDALRTAGLPTSGIGSDQALEVSLDPPSRGLVIGVSH